MELIIMILKMAVPLCIILILVMLPIFFIRKKINPNDKKNTLKSLIVKSLIASIIFVLIFGSGLIFIYIDEQNGIYRF